MSSAEAVVLSVLAAALFGAGALGAWRELRRGATGVPWTWRLALGGLASEMGALVAQWVSQGRMGFAAGAAGSLGLFAVCVGAGFLALRLRWRGPLWGVLLLPVASGAALGGALWGVARRGHPADIFGPGWAFLHVVPTVAGIACLVAGAALCVTYLVEERCLRSRRLGEVMRWLPALEVLDGLSGRVLTAAFWLLSVGLVAGALRALMWKELGVRWALDPKVLSAAATWALVGGVVAARRGGNFGGRRLAYLTLLAAALAAFTYVGVDALLGGAHAGL